MDTDTERTIAREFWGDDRRTWNDMTADEKTRAIAAHARQHAAPVTKATVPVAAPAPAFNMDKMIDAVVESVKGYVHQLVITDVGRQESQMRDIGEQLRRIGGTGDVKAMEQRIDRLAARVADLEAKQKD